MADFDEALLETLDSVNEKYFKEEQLAFTVVYRKEGGRTGTLFKPKFNVLSDTEMQTIRHGLCMLIEICKTMRQREIHRSVVKDSHILALQIRQIGDKIGKHMTEYFVEFTRMLEN